MTRRNVRYVHTASSPGNRQPNLDFSGQLYLKSRVDDSKLLGFYSASNALPKDAGGYGKSWDDVRGAGFGPTLNPIDAQGPLVVGDDPATCYLQTSPGHAFQSALTSLFDTSVPITVVWVGTFTHNGDPQSTANFGVSLGSDNAGLSFMGWDGSFLQNGSPNGPMIGSIFQPGGTEMKGNRPTSGRFRLFSAGRDATTGRFHSSPLPDVTAAISAIASMANRLRVGAGGGTYVTEKIRAVLVLLGVYPAADPIWLTLDTWARTYHGAKVAAVGAPRVLFEGDSLSVIPISASWPEQMTDRPEWAAYEDLNFAVSGSVVFPGFVWSCIPWRTPDVYAAAAAGAKGVSFMGGTNDIAILTRTGAAAAADYLADSDGYRAHGLKVGLWTLPARFNPPCGQSFFDTNRAAFNTAVRSGWSGHADYLFDLAALPAYASNTSYNDVDRFNQDDKTHFTAFGAGEIGAFASPGMLSLAA